VPVAPKVAPNSLSFPLSHVLMLRRRHQTSLCEALEHLDKGIFGNGRKLLLGLPPPHKYAFRFEAHMTALNR
jgi:hypothetical protein